jgi:hypothetical protein
MEIGNRNGQGAGTDRLHLTGSRGGAMEVARENLCSFLDMRIRKLKAEVSCKI